MENYESTLTDYGQLEAGKIYKVHHSRKGSCNFRADDWYSIDDDADAFVSGTITHGSLKGLGHGSHRIRGDYTTVRWSLCTFTKTW